MNAVDAREPARTTAERLCFGFVLLVWLQGLLALHAFVGIFAARAPAADDTALFHVAAQGRPLLSWLWELHNEHRLPLPKLLQLALYELTGDIRSGMYVQAQVYGAIALACVLAARRLRGGSRPWDAFFPLLWLQLGNSENLLMGFQLGIALPAASVVTVLLVAFSPARLAPSRAWAAGVALLALPLCGAGGLLQLPPLAAWSAWLGWRQRADPDPRTRRGARIHLACALLALALGALYLAGYEPPATAAYAVREHPRWQLGLAVLGAAFGPEACTWRPIAIALGALAAALLALAFARRAREGPDPRALGALAVLAAGLLLAAGIACGRPVAGPLLVAHRYIPLPAPFVVALVLGSLALLGRAGRELAPIAGCLAMLAATPGSIATGVHEGRLRREDERRLEQLVDARSGWASLHAHYAARFTLGDARSAEWLLRHFAARKLPPFDRGVLYADATREYPGFDTLPLAVRAETPPVNRFLDGELVCCVSPPTVFEFAVGPAARRLDLEVGVPELLLAQGLHPGVRGRVLLRSPDGTQSELGRIRLDPLHVERERGLLPFRFEWEPGAEGTLRLEFESANEPNGRRVADWIGLRRVRLE